MARERDDAAQPMVGLAELVEALKSFKGDDAETLKLKAQYDADATRKALHPENQTHPGISEFNPAGERDHPKPPLACDVFWVGHPQHTDALTPDEVRLFNALERTVFTSGFTEMNAQGHPCKLFHCKKLDGAALTVEVTGVRGDEKLLKMAIMFPAGRDNRNGLPSIAGLLRQMTGELDEAQAAQLAEIARLRKELAASSR